MTQIIQLFNVIAGFVVDIIYIPLDLLSPFWSLTILSLLISLLILSIFDKISNQTKLKRVKNRLRSDILAIRLFNEYLGVFFKIQGELLKDLVIYLRYNLSPLFFLIVPLFLVLAQLNLRYAKRGLEPNEIALVKVKWARSENLPKDVSLEADNGVQIETKGIRIPSEMETDWRIRAKEAGVHSLTLKVANETIEKSLIVGKNQAKVPEIRSQTPMDLLLYPGETPIKNPIVQSITVSYPNREILVFGYNIHWLILFLIGTIVFSFGLKGFFDIEI